MKKTATITAVVGAALVAVYLALAPAPVPTVTISWDDTNTGAVTWNVYASALPRLSAMWLVTNVSTPSFTMARTNPQQFFAVRAIRAGLESGWATR
jgi:hypothetical protein